MKLFIIFDNGGATPDRFTIIDKETGDIYGARENPDALHGTGKFIGNCADYRIAMYGSGWRQRLPAKKIIKTEIENYINDAKLDPEWIGTEVDFKSLPENVREYISHIDPHRRAEGPSGDNIVYMASNGQAL